MPPEKIDWGIVQAADEVRAKRVAEVFAYGTTRCRCIEPVEKTFPEKTRVRISRISLEERIASLRESNKGNPACGTRLYCDRKATAPPKGLFPGIW